MSELRIQLPEDVAERLAERAEAEATTPEQLAGDAVRSYVGEPLAVVSNGHQFAFIGMVNSGHQDLSERVEEILAADFDG